MASQNLVKGVAMLIIIRYSNLIVRQSEVASAFLKPRVNLTLMNPYKTDRAESITLDDIFISVKTTRYYQVTRLPLILKTWFELAKDQIWFFTDMDDQINIKLTNGHMINTKCKASHEDKSLCCKTSVEYDYYLKTYKKWFCHFDDDNYVNIPQLVTVLQRYDPKKDWYLGQISLDTPTQFEKNNLVAMFSFATGGAGMCISRSLVLRMSPFVSGGRLVAVCEYLRHGDDVSLGYIIEILLHTPLTVVPEFHSHLEDMGRLDASTFREQVSFGYSVRDENVINIPGFPKDYDPTRFLSLHCHLFPRFNFCRGQQTRHEKSRISVKGLNRLLLPTNRSHACKELPSVL